MTRTLVLVRHAAAQPAAASDRERELTAQGREQARAAGAWLAGLGIVPDHALVSDSERTRQTWAELGAAAGWSLEPEYDAALYSAGPETVLDLLALAPADAGTIVVLGHNPTIATLAAMLDDGEGDPGSTALMARGFPAGSAAVFAVDRPWAEVQMGSARLEAFRPGEPG